MAMGIQGGDNGGEAIECTDRRGGEQATLSSLIGGEKGGKEGGVRNLP